MSNTNTKTNANTNDGIERQYVGAINKILFQNAGLQVMIVNSLGTNSVQSYKLFDFDSILDHVREEDIVTFSGTSHQERVQGGGGGAGSNPNPFAARNFVASQPLKLQDLIEFRRPFSSGQVYGVLKDIKALRKKQLDQITGYLNLGTLGQYLADKNFDKVRDSMVSTGLDSALILKIMAKFERFSNETDNFKLLAITNLLVRHKRCQLDEKAWVACRKMFRHAVSSGVSLDFLRDTICSDPYQLLLDQDMSISANKTNFEIIDYIAKYGPVSKIKESQPPIDLSLSRVKAGILTSLLDRVNSTGHCYVLDRELQQASQQLLGTKKTVTLSEIKSVRQAKVYNINGTTIIYPDYLDSSEHLIVDYFKNYQFERPANDTNHAVTRADIIELDPDLDPSQVEIIYGIIATGLGILTGPPGVGKTRVISVIQKIIASTSGEKLILAAPTGMACKNISKIVEVAEQGGGGEGGSVGGVFTVAKLLYAGTGIEGGGGSGGGREVEIANSDDDSDGRGDGGYDGEDGDGDGDDDGEKCLLERMVSKTGGLVIDETSMLDVTDFANILRKIPRHNFRLILVGDPNQLPSIGPGQILQSLINSGVIPVYRLERNYRQREGSTIIDNAMKILSGDFDLTLAPDFKIAHTSSDNETVVLLGDLIEHLKSTNSLESTVILSPYSMSGFLASNNLNKLVREYFNPVNHLDREKAKNNFILDDRVMQTVNNYKYSVVNGDIGKVVDLKYRGQILDEVVIEFPSALGVTFRVKYRGSEIREQLTLAYVISIHKSQGNGYDNVVILLPQTYNGNFFNRNMIYTAVTRAKKKLFMFGGSITTAVRTVARCRNTRLAARLKSKVDLKHLNDLIDPETCAICQSDPVEVTLPCGHHGCRECLGHWLTVQDSCPFCRRGVQPPFCVAATPAT